MHNQWVNEGPLVSGKTFDQVKTFCVKADGAPGNCLHASVTM